MRNEMALANIKVLQTLEHPCGYFSARRARNLVVDPTIPRQAVIYDAVTHAGFRRAGDLIFKPHCRGCNACKATRIPTKEFVLSRSQQRCMARNSDLEVEVARKGSVEGYFALYQRYVNARHPGGGMDNPRPEDFEGFLMSDWARTEFLEIRHKGKLLAVAVTDCLSSGLSAVYTFFAPEHGDRSLGTLAILAQIELARERSLPYLYLGYWIANHPKMEYKRRFRPLEVFADGSWKRLES